MLVMPHIENCGIIYSNFTASGTNASGAMFSMLAVDSGEEIQSLILFLPPVCSLRLENYSNLLPCRTDAPGCGVQF